MTEKNSSMQRILLVEDHPVARQGLAELINGQKDLTVCGEAESLPQALDQIAKRDPALVVLDITLKGSNGVEVLKHIKTGYPKLKVLMLSMHDEGLYALRAIRAGASGYIMKHEATDRILAAIRRVLNGDIYLSDRMEKRTLQQLARTADYAGSPLEILSDRELEVFNMIGQGKGTRQIAEDLHLSIKTVESHRAHIKEKLHLSNATELVQHAIQWRDV
jgi:DNA-binding NarL/FixJ family response regulator